MVYEHFALRRDDGSEMVELGNVNADVDHDPFLPRVDAATSV